MEQMRTGPGILCGLLLSGTIVLCAQSGSGKLVPPPANSGSTAGKPAGIPASVLEQDFFAIVRRGDTKQFLAYLPKDGVNLGRDAQLSTRAEIEEQFAHHSGLYCKVFDSSCIQSTIKLDASTPPCSYRELLTQSEKVRTASTETTRNGVRQAILVAEVHNQKCAGPGLIDFIFNYHEGGWKLFSIP
jgi:hypothetical protein